ncbi:MAG: GNAT family N-acetyltransferase [Alkalibacterium sp.]|nr:GNAT family N-acetyltransferase [Alkalibacterium sp.]
MNISPLHKHHYSEMRKLFLDVFTASPWFDEWTDEKQLDLYLKDLTGNHNSLSLCLFDENNKLIGGSLGYTFNWWQGKEYFIKEFFISTDSQNKGIGSLFLEQLTVLLKKEDITHITLMTDKGVPAYHFYQKNGFTEQSESVFFAKKID